MPDTKTETMTIRVTPTIKAALRTAAARDHRSLTNMVEVMIRDYCARGGTEISELAPETPEAPASPGTPTRRSS